MMPMAECNPRLILRLWDTHPSGRPVVLPSTSASTVDLASAPPGVSTTRRHGHYTSHGSRTALHYALGRNFFRRWPAPQMVYPAGWAPYPEPSYGRPMVCSHLLSIRGYPRDKDVPLSANYGCKSIAWPAHLPGLPAGRSSPGQPRALFGTGSFLRYRFQKVALVR